MATSKFSWEQGPLEIQHSHKYKTGETGQYTEVASTMAFIHNAIVRGYNAIYIQAPNVEPAEYANFIGFSNAWWELIEHHHHGEETGLFPNIEKAVGETGLMDANVEQHKAFHNGLHKYRAYLTSLKGRESIFNGNHLRTIMDSFGPTLSTHLADEIPSLLSLSRYGDKLPLQRLWDEEGERVMGGMSKLSALRVAFACFDTMWEDGIWKQFPPAP